TEAGAIKTLGKILPDLAPDKGMQALVIGWVFASFLQGVGGFGVPVAVIAPILIGLGFSPLAAVVIPSIGHGWAVTFGSLGSSFNALMATTGLSSNLLAPPAAIFLGIAGIITGWLVAFAAGGKNYLRKQFILVIIVGTVMGAGQFFAATAGIWNIAAFIGSIFGMMAILPFTNRNKERALRTINWKSVWEATANYVILIIIILAVQFIPGLKPFMSQIKLNINFPEIVTDQGFSIPAGPGRSIPVFSHAGVLLFYAAIIGYLFYWKKGTYKKGAWQTIISGTFKKITSSSVSILSMVSLAVIMEHSGMTTSLARGLSTSLSSIYPAISPLIGAIGAFMTGSNTNSNVVFGVLQLQTAQILQYPEVIILAGQTAGAAVASVVAPTKIIVGASTAGMTGREGEVMRSMIIYTAILVLVISMLTVISVRIFG
ncbi:MAG: hypothetical protein GWN62_08625, partial [Aliifodinibius sp.]|nr:hypothetical protein [Fodinibius sp.]